MLVMLMMLLVVLDPSRFMPVRRGRRGWWRYWYFMGPVVGVVVMGGGPTMERLLRWFLTAMDMIELLLMLVMELQSRRVDKWFVATMHVVLFRPCSNGFMITSFNATTPSCRCRRR